MSSECITFPVFLIITERKVHFDHLKNAWNIFRRFEYFRRFQIIILCITQFLNQLYVHVVQLFTLVDFVWYAQMSS